MGDPTKLLGRKKRRRQDRAKEIDKEKKKLQDQVRRPGASERIGPGGMDIRCLVVGCASFAKLLYRVLWQVNSLQQDLRRAKAEAEATLRTLRREEGTTLAETTRLAAVLELKQKEGRLLVLQTKILRRTLRDLVSGTVQARRTKAELEQSGSMFDLSAHGSLTGV
jgi:hypothetical protein